MLHPWAIIFLLLLTPAHGSFGSNILNKVVIDTPDAGQLHSRLQQAGVDVGHAPLGKQVVAFVLNISELTPLLNRDDIIVSRNETQNFADELQGYFDPEMVRNELSRLAEKYSGYAALHDIANFVGLDDKSTFEGRRLWALQVTKKPGQLTPRRKVMIIGQHHAREVMTPHAVLDAAADLLAKVHSGEPEAEDLKKTAVWFVPTVNPDGAAHVFAGDRWWRKNRRENPDGSFGVDTNRNYEFGWGECGRFSHSPRSQTYLGPSKASEPEVILMDALNKLLKAQYVISYHSHGNEVLYPYRCGHITGDKEIYDESRDRLAALLGYGKRRASSSGEDFEHHFARHGSISFLLEIGESFQPSFSQYKNAVRPVVLQVLPFLMSELAEPALAIEVVDRFTGRGLEGVEVALAEAVLSSFEIRKTDTFGIHRRRLPVGVYSVDLEKPGYLRKTTFIAVSSENKLNKVYLEPAQQ